MSLNYVRDKLAAAVACLNNGAGSLQERLSAAAMGCHILVAPPQLDDGFPSRELKARFRAWWLAMTSTSAVADEGVLHATTSAMSNETARRLADELFALYNEVDAAYLVRRGQLTRR